MRRLAAVLLLTAAVPALADEASEKAAGALLHQHLEAGDKQLLDGLEGKEILVVRGEYDHIESVLRAAGIKHTSIAPNQVYKAPLHNRMIVMIDCPGEIGPQGRDNLEKFVRAGGLLYTTDWALANVVQRAFPGTIRHNGASTGDELISVQVDKSDDNVMSNVLLQKGDKPSWWLEGGSYPIKVLDPSKVEVLASSKTLKKRYGSAPVVVRVRWEDGEIIHVVSHFYRQLDAKDSAANVASSYAFQRMTGNLVTTKLKKNVDLEREYGASLGVGTALRSDAAPAAAAPSKSAGTGRAKVLEKKGDQVRVRDDAGNEGWVDAAALH